MKNKLKNVDDKIQVDSTTVEHGHPTCAMQVITTKLHEPQHTMQNINIFRIQKSKTCINKICTEIEITTLFMMLEYKDNHSRESKKELMCSKHKFEYITK